MVIKGDVYSADEKKSLTETKNKYYLELLNNITPKDILPGVLDSNRTSKQ